MKIHYKTGGESPHLGVKKMRLVFIGILLIMVAYLFAHWVEGFDAFSAKLTGCNTERALAVEELNR